MKSTVFLAILFFFFFFFFFGLLSVFFLNISFSSLFVQDEKAEGFVSLPEFKIDRASECRKK